MNKTNIYDLLLQLGSKDTCKLNEVFDSNQRSRYHKIMRAKSNVGIGTILDLINALGYDIQIVNKKDIAECYTIEPYDNSMYVEKS